MTGLRSMMQQQPPHHIKGTVPEASRASSWCSSPKMIHTIVTSTLVVVAFAIVPSACGMTSNNCVTSFSDFEQATITDNATNVQALVKAFYQTNSVFPLSVQVVYHVNSSNGTDTIISPNPNCSQGKEMWLWVPSPVFIFIDPTRLNLYALNTLNYFNEWKPRRAHIYVPKICNTGLNQFNFLNDLTMRVSIDMVYGP